MLSSCVYSVATVPRIFCQREWAATKFSPYQVFFSPINPKPRLISSYGTNYRCCSAFFSVLCPELSVVTFRAFYRFATHVPTASWNNLSFNPPAGSRLARFEVHLHAKNPKLFFGWDFVFVTLYLTSPNHCVSQVFFWNYPQQSTYIVRACERRESCYYYR